MTQNIGESSSMSSPVYQSPSVSTVPMQQVATYQKTSSRKWAVLTALVAGTALALLSGFGIVPAIIANLAWATGLVLGLASTLFVAPISFWLQRRICTAKKMVLETNVSDDVSEASDIEEVSEEEEYPASLPHKNNNQLTEQLTAFLLAYHQRLESNLAQLQETALPSASPEQEAELSNNVTALSTELAVLKLLDSSNGVLLKGERPIQETSALKKYKQANSLTELHEALSDLHAISEPLPWIQFDEDIISDTAKSFKGRRKTIYSGVNKDVSRANDVFCLRIDGNRMKYSQGEGGSQIYSYLLKNCFQKPSQKHKARILETMTLMQTGFFGNVHLKLAPLLWKENSSFNVHITDTIKAPPGGVSRLCYLNSSPLEILGIYSGYLKTDSDMLLATISGALWIDFDTRKAFWNWRVTNVANFVN